MRIFVSILVFSLLVLPASFASAESLDNFPIDLGVKCQRASHGDFGGEFFVYYFNTGSAMMAKISTKDDQNYKVSMPQGAQSFSDRKAALDHVKNAMCSK